MTVEAFGINSIMHVGFQTAYETAADVAGYTQVAFDSSTLDGKQELAERATLGFGRDGADSYTEALDVTGDIVVDGNARSLGIWLKAGFGQPTSVAALAAAGSFTFKAQPVATSTITLNGVAWTFVTAAPAALQVLIGANLAATMTALATALNASADVQTAKCTYTATATGINVVYDVLGGAGNAFTLAASANSNAKRSGPKLKGGAYTHTFTSGAINLPWLSIHIGRPDVSRYSHNIGCMVNSIKFGLSRKGRLLWTISLIGQRRDRLRIPVAFTAPVVFSEDEILVQRQGEIRRDGALMAEVVASDFEASNGLVIKENPRGDGLIGGCQPQDFTSGGAITARITDDEEILQDLAEAGTTFEVQRNWSARPGLGVSVIQHRVKLPVPSEEIRGGGAIELSYQTRAERDPTLGRKVTVILTNDVASY